MEPDVIAALRRAVAAAPQDVTLRVHLAEQLLQTGDGAGAVAEAAAALGVDPSNEEARTIMARALQPGPPGSGAGAEAPDPGAAPAGGEPDEFDWAAAQAQFDHDPDDPLFSDSKGPHTSSAEGQHVGNDRYSIDTPAITLADVGGMKTVKDRLNAAFLAPLRNPELRQRFAKTLRGGLLLYGPPGCGKTFIARALAGELGAKFLSIGITDVLDPHFGQSERNLHDAFQLARREAPCVLFFDEVDALGGRRSHTSNSMMRTAVNQLLSELDGVGTDNDGVFVLAATNQPWEVDPALRRPGRFDRTVLVLPPDREARAAIFAFHLRTRPTETIDIDALARDSEGLSGADIALACESATEAALMDGVTTGVVRDISQADVAAALREINPSVMSWLDSARNIVLFGDDDGTYKDLRAYLKKVRRL